MSVNPASPGKWRVRVAGLPRQGRDIEIEASAAEREEIAEAFDLVDVSRFHAALHLAPAGRDGVRLSGRLEADARQACVVTLEPVESRVAENIERAFVASDSGPAPEEPDVAQAEVYVDLDTADPPEPFDGVALDLKTILLEALALGLDPYPRKPGVEAADVADDAPEGRGPFAALEQLKGAEKQEKP